MKLYNRNFAVGERIEYMGWVNEGVINNNISWQSYKPRFLLLKGTEVMLFETPPVSNLKGYLQSYNYPNCDPTSLSNLKQAQHPIKPAQTRLTSCQSKQAQLFKVIHNSIEYSTAKNPFPYFSEFPYPSPCDLLVSKSLPTSSVI